MSPHPMPHKKRRGWSLRFTWDTGVMDTGVRSQFLLIIVFSFLANPGHKPGFPEQNRVRGAKGLMDARPLSRRPYPHVHGLRKHQYQGTDWNGTYLSGYLINVGRVRRAVCAVTHRACRQAHVEKGVVLLRNGWWVTQKR
jgi:hypothetical protein